MNIKQNNIRVLLCKETYNAKELAYLAKLLNYCNDIYYNSEEDSPLSDAEYDLLYKRYNQQSSTPITSLTPAREGKRLVNVSHDYPELVGTLGKITNKEELKEWIFDKYSELGLKPTEKVKMIYSHKEDGNSICGTFNEDGTPKSFLTRGKDGEGADMTSRFQDIKLKLPVKTPMEFGIKFEAVMTNENFDEYNEEYLARNGRELSSNRSAVGGILNGDKNAEFINYVQLVPLTVKVKGKELDKEKQIKIIEKFYKQNPRILPYQYFITEGTAQENYEAIAEYYDKMSEERVKLNKPIDGLVIEFNDVKYRERLGRSDGENNFDVALKFPPLAKPSTVKDIRFYYGKSGRITPVVHFEPVYFNGAECKNVSISNYKRYKELNLSVGDHVNITYNHDVLCYLHLDPTKKQLNNPIPFITKCPICHEELEVNENETFVSCVNKQCAGRKAGRIENYLIKMGIKGIKANTIERLFQARLIDDIEDLYKLTVNEIMSMDGFKATSAANIYEAINGKKDVKSYELLGSLQIPQFSLKSAKEVLKYYTLDELVKLHRSEKKFISEISDLHGFKDITARHLYDGIESNKKTIKELLKVLNVEETKLDPNAVAEESYTFVFTGFRDKDLQDKLESKGHKVTSSVSKNTNYLVVKDVNSTSSKVKKAKEIGVNVISIEDAKLMTD